MDTEENKPILPQVAIKFWVECASCGRPLTKLSTLAYQNSIVNKRFASPSHHFFHFSDGFNQGNKKKLVDK
jgi:hypothetical protein